MTNALATRNSSAMLPDAQTWQTMLGMADSLVQSGLLPTHIKTPQAAVAIIQKGRELDIPPMYALSNIVVIQGKPTANAELMLALIYRDHGDGAVTFVESTNDRCTIAYRRAGWPKPQTYSFTIEDARKANLVGKDTWKSYPAAMLRARAISAVARMAFPDTIGGLYTPEELGATVDAEGDVVDVPAMRDHWVSEKAPQPDDVSETFVAGTAEVVDVETGEIHDGVTSDDIEEWLLRMEAQFQDVTSRSDLEDLWRQVSAEGYAKHQRMRDAARNAAQRIEAGQKTLAV